MILYQILSLALVFSLLNIMNLRLIHVVTLALVHSLMLP